MGIGAANTFHPSGDLFMIEKIYFPQESFNPTAKLNTGFPAR